MVSPEMLSLVGRHLEGAVLINANLRNVDFTRADLKEAVLDYADLREAKFECAATAYRQSGMNLLDRIVAEEAQQCADLRRASLYNAQLQGAIFGGSLLQGAWLDSAQLQGAWFFEARLQGAVLNFAQLQGASFYDASLQGASLDSAQLQGADLRHADFRGALLDSAQLQGASLDDAQLQGASLKNTKLQDASLRDLFVWRAAPPRDVDAEGALIINPRTRSIFQGYCPEYKTCNFTSEAVAKLGRLIAAAMPPQRKERKEALARIALLDPGNRSEWLPEGWTGLERSTPPPAGYEKDYEKALAARLKQLSCTAEDAPYVIRGLLQGSFENRFTADPALAAAVANAFLDAANCPDAQGLSEQSKASLRKIIRRREVMAKP
jgi:uncharacterized protein YjbI with pentapeptide repeats